VLPKLDNERFIIKVNTQNKFLQHDPEHLEKSLPAAYVIANAFISLYILIEVFLIYSAV
jgi:hypothetical protein